VSVLLNTTATGETIPTFAIQKAFATGSGPQSVAVADVNGDGKPDLIVANADDNTVTVLLNTTSTGATTPTYATQKAFSTGSGPPSASVADVNGDGKADLFAYTAIVSTVSVLLNTTATGATTPTFATQKAFATGNVPYSVAVADVNGDGKAD